MRGLVWKRDLTAGELLEIAIFLTHYAAGQPVPG
jgi:hypothetical protein